MGFPRFNISLPPSVHRSSEHLIAVRLNIPPNLMVTSRRGLIANRRAPTLAFSRVSMQRRPHNDKQLPTRSVLRLCRLSRLSTVKVVLLPRSIFPACSFTQLYASKSGPWAVNRLTNERVLFDNQLSCYGYFANAVMAEKLFPRE